jgi:Cu/Ag efflux protein CusF
VTISVAPEGKPQIVQIEPVKDQVKVVIVSESKKEKKVSEVTGDVTTVTTEVKEVDEKSKNYTAEILKSVP